MNRRRRWTLVPVAAVAVSGMGVAAVAATAGANRPLDSKIVGRQSDGSYLTPANQFLTPAGATIRYNLGRLQDTAISPDGRTAVSLAWHEFAGSIAVFDLAGQRLLQHYTPAPGTGSGDVSFRGVLWSADGKTVWAAQSRDLLKFPVRTDRTLGTPTVATLPGGSQAAIPSGLAWSPDGTHLLVTLNGLNTLAVLDAGTGAVTKQIPVGNAPRDVVVMKGRAYVANQGGRRANKRDFTNDSYGTPIVSDTTDGRAITGTVSEVDLSKGRTVRDFTTGLQPTSLLAHGSDLLVTNSNDDSVTVIDTAGQRVGQTINVDPAPGQK